MTEPSARATSVRRTVTVATVLVLSQAVLGGVIGWVTFSGGEPARSQPRAAEPLLGPTIVVPTMGVAPVSPPAHRRTRKAKVPAAVEQRETVPARATPSRSPRVRTATGRIFVPPRPSAPGRTTEPQARPPRPSASPAPDDAEVGQKCATEYADGRTAAGVAVRCLRNTAGDLIWQLS